MDGTASYGSSSSSFESRISRERPVATQEKPRQKQTDVNLDDRTAPGDDNITRNAHKLATSSGAANGILPTADPSVVAADDSIDMDGAWHDDMDDSLAYLQQFLSEDSLADTPEVIQLKKALKAAHAEYNDLMQEARDSNHNICSQEILFNFLSGANAFLMCFGVGTLAASATGVPLASWAISTALWALTERISPMIRNTTWTNPHADKTYPLLGNLIQRSARNLVRQMAGMPPLQSSDKGDASNDSDDVQLSDIGITGFLKAWLGKMSTEDLPYYFYTLFYGMRYSIVAPLKWPSTSFASLATLLLAGITAGASTATTTHFLRRTLHQQSENGNQFNGQVITKTMAMWEKELAILKMYQQLFSTYNHTSDTGQQLKGRRIDKKDLVFLKNIIHKSEQKSKFISSILFEIKAMVNVKRDIADQRGEVAGKLSEFLAGLLAKASVLGISTAWNYGFTIPMLKATASVGGAVDIGAMWGQYGMLILAFNARKEFELAYRGVLGLCLGIWDVCSENFSCLPTAPQENSASEIRRSMLSSMNSTNELMADYKQREKLSDKTSKHQGAMDGDDKNGNGNDNDNLGSISTSANDNDDVTVSVTMSEQMTATAPPNGEPPAKTGNKS